MDEYFEHIYHERRDFKYKTLIYYTSNFFDPAAQLWDNFVTEYLGEIAIEFKNTYAYLSVAQMGSNPEKIQVKISWHTPFNLLFGLSRIFMASRA